MVELAVFGGLFLVVFSAMIRIGLSFLYTQALQQQSFRDALGVAKVANNRAQVTLIQDRLFPEANPPFFASTRSRMNSSGSVFWSNDSSQFGGGSLFASQAEAEGFANNGQVVLRINCNNPQISNCEEKVASGDLADDPNLRVILPTSTKHVTVSGAQGGLAEARFERQETQADIRTRREVMVQETVTTDFTPGIFGSPSKTQTLQTPQARQRIPWTITPNPTTE